MKIFNIVGKSGSGKSYMVDLVKDYFKDIHVIESFTTREPRFEGETGHVFIDSPEIEFIYQDAYYSFNSGDIPYFLKSEYIVASQELYKHLYFVTRDCFNPDLPNLYVVDEEGAKQVVEYFENDKNVEVVNILLDVEDMILKQRLFNREINSGVDSSVAYKNTRERFERDIELEFDIGFYDYIISNNLNDDLDIIELWDEILYG